MNSVIPRFGFPTRSAPRTQTAVHEGKGTIRTAQMGFPVKIPSITKAYNIGLRLDVDSPVPTGFYSGADRTARKDSISTGFSRW